MTLPIGAGGARQCYRAIMSLSCRTSGRIMVGAQEIDRSHYETNQLHKHPTDPHHRGRVSPRIIIGAGAEACSSSAVRHSVIRRSLLVSANVRRTDMSTLTIQNPESLMERWRVAGRPHRGFSANKSKCSTTSPAKFCAVCWVCPSDYCGDRCQQTGSEGRGFPLPNFSGEGDKR